MFYLLWALLNIGLFAWFIFIAFNATRYIREKSGALAATVFVIGLMSFIGSAGTEDDNKEPDSDTVKTWKYNSRDQVDNKSNEYIEVALETTMISTYFLAVSYGRDKELKKNIPISANTSTIGLRSGTSWKPRSIIINQTADDHLFQYQVDGTVKWTILGITVYAQSKSWTGVVTLK